MTGTEYFKQIQDLLNKAAKDKDLSADDYGLLLDDVATDVEAMLDALDEDHTDFDEPSETDDDGTDLYDETGDVVA